jgi:tagatose 6-phosphate kinase
MLDARKAPLRAALKEPAFVVKLNRDELAETVGGTLDSDESLRRAMAATMPEHGMVVVTSGSRGAVVLSGGRAWRVIPPAVAARSAVGSGDAFAAGMTVGLLRGQEPHQAAALGAACGAANAMTDLAGHLSVKDVNELLPKVRVGPL